MFKAVLKKWFVEIVKNIEQMFDKFKFFLYNKDIFKNKKGEKYDG